VLFEPEFVIQVDGASRGNPGDASYGFVISDRNGNILHTGADYIGIATNNEAEYTGLVKALEFALSREIRSLEIRSDSELMVRQLLNEYRVRAGNLEKFHQACRDLLRKFQWYEIKHVPREENKLADRLANQALDEAARKK
jgi:ribonuclease HI